MPSSSPSTPTAAVAPIAANGRREVPPPETGGRSCRPIDPSTDATIGSRRGAFLRPAGRRPGARRKVELRLVQSENQDQTDPPAVVLGPSAQPGRAALTQRRCRSTACPWATTCSRPSSKVGWWRGQGSTSGSSASRLIGCRSNRAVTWPLAGETVRTTIYARFFDDMPVPVDGVRRGPRTRTRSRPHPPGDDGRVKDRLEGPAGQ